MEALFSILISTFLVSLISFIGILFLLLKENLINKILMVLVSLSAGVLIGTAFLHLIPESLEKFNQNAFIYVLIGFSLFFLIEKILHWRHCHDAKCKIHSFAYMNLFGEAIHNFIDGLIIAASFITNFSLGISASLAIALHEIPQELSDFGVLIYGGFTKLKALFLNFLIALTAVAGGLIGYYFLSSELIKFLLPFAAGGFIYIAASDLIPELRKELDIKKAFLNFGIFILGIILMYLV